MNTIYKTSAKSIGGSTGKVIVENSPLELKLAMLSEFKEKSIDATNPEQLFAAGYAACFASALHSVIRSRKVDVQLPVVEVEAGLAKDNDNGYYLTASIVVTFNNIEQNLADELVNKAHQVCPYSKATRNNIEVAVSAIIK